MKFWKLHGIGNDFVAIDGRFDNKEASDYSEYAKAFMGTISTRNVHIVKSSLFLNFISSSPKSNYIINMNIINFFKVTIIS